MKTVTSKININRLLIGAGYSVWAATKVTTVICLVTLLAFAAKAPFTELISAFLGGLFILLLFGSIISFFTALFIGIPVAILLIKSGLDDVLISSFLGAMIVGLYFLFNGKTENYVLFFMIYGFFCAGEFMKGYKKL